jgi:hypothetical protein
MLLPEADFTIDGGSSIYRLTINTEAAQQWVEANVDVSDYMWLGRFSFGVEWRYVAEIIAGAQADGLTVSGDGG